MSLSDSASTLLDVPSTRKPSEAKSVDSGYCGPSRETSTALLRKSPDLPNVQEKTEGIKISMESLSPPHNMSTSFTNIIHVGDEATSSEASELHFTTDYPRVATTEASQSSIMHFNESHLPISLTLSSSGSPSQQSILHIKITSSGESQPHPDTRDKSAIKSRHCMSMTAEQEDILRRTVEKKTHFFTKNTNFVTLLPYLYEKKLLHPGECETLGTFPSSSEKGNHFYMVILPQKGKHAYRSLYKCLKKETEHLGHKDLIEILDKALRGEQSPQSSSDSSPTMENNSDHADQGTFHKLGDSSNPPSTVKADINSSSSNDTLISNWCHCLSCKCRDSSQMHAVSSPHPPLCSNPSDDGNGGRSDLAPEETPPSQSSDKDASLRNGQTNGCCTIL